MYEFDLIRAQSLAEAVNLLRDDEEAKILGGGQTLLPAMKQRLAMPSQLVTLRGIEGMAGVRQAGDGTIEIGGGTTHAEVAVATSSSFPALSGLADRIGDPAVRSRGTIGGSLANNDPAACYPAAVLACGATVVTTAREIAADDFFLGTFETALEPDEIITAVRFPVPEAGTYLKFIQPASRFSIVGIFVARFAETTRIAVTGASADGVFRWTKGEEALAAGTDAAGIAKRQVATDGMISDIFGSAEYRAALIPVLVARALADTAVEPVRS